MQYAMIMAQIETRRRPWLLKINRLRQIKRNRFIAKYQLVEWYAVGWRVLAFNESIVHIEWPYETPPCYLSETEKPAKAGLTLAA